MSQVLGPKVPRRSDLDPAALPQCQLFSPPADSKLLEGHVKERADLGDIGRWKKTVKK